MPLFEMIQTAAYLLFGLVGLGLVAVGAWGSVRLPRQRVESPLTVRQRVQFTLMGLLLIGIAWAFLTDRLPRQ